MRPRAAELHTLLHQEAKVKRAVTDGVFQGKCAFSLHADNVGVIHYRRKSDSQLAVSSPAPHTRPFTALPPACRVWRAAPTLRALFCYQGGTFQCVPRVWVSAVLYGRHSPDKEAQLTRKYRRAESARGPR